MTSVDKSAAIACLEKERMQKMQRRISLFILEWLTCIRWTGMQPQWKFSIVQGKQCKQTHEGFFFLQIVWLKCATMENNFHLQKPMSHSPTWEKALIHHLKNTMRLYRQTTKNSFYIQKERKYRRLLLKIWESTLLICIGVCGKIPYGANAKDLVVLPE